MIYIHYIYEIRHRATDILVKTQEKLVKFENEKAWHEANVKQLQNLSANGLLYGPGQSARHYVDVNCRQLTQDEVKFVFGECA